MTDRSVIIVVKLEIKWKMFWFFASGKN